MLKTAYHRGVVAALTRFKIAIPLSGASAMGADPGVAPAGPEQSHGTDRIEHGKGARTHTDAASPLPQDQFNADWLWQNQDLERMGPGMVSGFGQENIG